ncbi:putative RNA-directed DNA polymerase [Senna tora]|uniref:Putative RNA-directed DNA polymerase n=1 Tax=Senna tora TaxID=362788 RepID=A0A834SZP1_9FABA|nr:putative RNA-directed DNA polymerase [Senna tora]
MDLQVDGTQPLMNEAIFQGVHSSVTAVSEGMEITMNVDGELVQSPFRVWSDLKRGHKVDFLVVLEPRQSGSNAVNFIRKFGFDEHDRVVCGWYLVCGCGGSSWLFTVVYGGDFNAFISSNEKAGGSENGSQPDKGFGQWIDDGFMVDLGFSGSDFTWSKGSISIRLDCVVVNECVNIRHDRPFRFRALWVMHVNFSNMVKKAWGTVNQKDDLWTCILRTKYRCWDDVLPQMKSSGNSSRLWKGVVRNWDHVVNGLKWRIGNGRTTHFWTNGTGLILNFLLLDFVCKLIAAISPPSEFHASDKVAWKHSSDGSFSVKTAYNSIVGVDNTQQDDWRKIWSLKVPQRIHSFLCLSGHTKLLTNKERVIHGMADHAECSRCRRGSEDIHYAIRDCCMLRNIWMRLLGAAHLDWSVTFAMASWSLWKWRNEEIFNITGNEGVDHFFTIMHRVNIEDFKQSLGHSTKKQGRVNKVVRWVKPDLLGGSNRDLGSALGLGNDVASRRVIVEMDSLVAYGLVQGSIAETHPFFFLINQIQLLLGRDWEVRLYHIYREGNFAAYAMAFYAHTTSCSLNFINSPPVQVACVLDDELKGVGSICACAL